eukprot:m.187658 g.187658  ORF g.187658 m.187658 type:complete len:893 (+) comp16932_c0_seq2:72-2750(+)
MDGSVRLLQDAIDASISCLSDTPRPSMLPTAGGTLALETYLACRQLNSHASITKADTTNAAVIEAMQQLLQLVNFEHDPVWHDSTIALAKYLIENQAVEAFSEVLTTNKNVDVVDVVCQSLPGLSPAALTSWLHASSTKHIADVASQWLGDTFVPCVAQCILTLLQTLDQHRFHQVLHPLVVNKSVSKLTSLMSLLLLANDSKLLNSVAAHMASTPSLLIAFVQQTTFQASLLELVAFLDGSTRQQWLQVLQQASTTPSPALELILDELQHCSQANLLEADWSTMKWSARTRQALLEVWLGQDVPTTWMPSERDEQLLDICSTSIETVLKESKHFTCRHLIASSCSTKPAHTIAALPIADCISLLQGCPTILVGSSLRATATWETVCRHPDIAKLCSWSRLAATPSLCQLGLWLHYLDLAYEDDEKACRGCHLLLQAITACDPAEGNNTTLVEMLGTNKLKSLNISKEKAMQLASIATDYQLSCQARLEMDPIAVQCDSQSQYPQYRYQLLCLLLRASDQSDQIKAGNRLCKALTKLLQSNPALFDEQALASFANKLGVLPVGQGISDNIVLLALTIAKHFPLAISFSSLASMACQHAPTCSMKLLSIFTTKVTKALEDGSLSPAAILDMLVASLERSFAATAGDKQAVKLFGKTAQAVACITLQPANACVLLSSAVLPSLVQGLELGAFRANSSLALLELVKVCVVHDMDQSVPLLAPCWDAIIQHGLQEMAQDASDVGENIAQMLSEVTQRQPNTFGVRILDGIMDALACHSAESSLFASSPAVFDMANVLASILTQDEARRHSIAQKPTHLGKVVDLLLTAGQAFETEEQVTSIAVLQLIESMVKPKSTRSLLASSSILKVLATHRWTHAVTQCGQQLERLVQTIRLSA